VFEPIAWAGLFIPGERASKKPTNKVCNASDRIQCAYSRGCKEPLVPEKSMCEQHLIQNRSKAQKRRRDMRENRDVSQKSHLLTGGLDGEESESDSEEEVKKTPSKRAASHGLHSRVIGNKRKCVDGNLSNHHGKVRFSHSKMSAMNWIATLPANPMTMTL
jgi:hypothetical protein